MRDLNIIDDEPYLKQYFQNELSDNKNNYHLPQKRMDKLNKLSVQNVNKNINNNVNININQNNNNNINNNNNNNKNRQLNEQSSLHKLPIISPPYIQQPSPNINRRKKALSLK